MVKKYEGNYEVIGSDVIKAIEEVYGGAKDSPADEGLVKSMR